MSEQLLPWAVWAGAILLAILCLPVWGLARGVVEVAAWALRLALIGLLAGGAYLWFRPAELPARVSSILDSMPGFLSILPDRGTPAFALCAASWVVAALVPFLAVLEVARRATAVRRVDAPVVAAAPVAEAVLVEPAPEGVPVLRPIDRRTASATIASDWGRGPVRTTR